MRATAPLTTPYPPPLNPCGSHHACAILLARTACDRRADLAASSGARESGSTSLSLAHAARAQRDGANGAANAALLVALTAAHPLARGARARIRRPIVAQRREHRAGGERTLACARRGCLLFDAASGSLGASARRGGIGSR